MSILWTILIGFVVGLIARALMPGKDTLGFILTTLLGIGGAVLAKYLGQGLGLYTENEPAGFLMSLLGAMLILFLFNIYNKRTHNPL